MKTLMFVAVTGGATFSPEGLENEEPDVDNAQVIQIVKCNEQDNPDEIWDNLIKYNSDIAKFKDEEIVVYQVVKIVSF